MGALSVPNAGHQLDFVERFRPKARNASPLRWLGDSPSGPGTHLYELAPPLPVLEVSNAGPPPFREYSNLPDQSGRIRAVERTPYSLDLLTDEAVRQVVVDDPAGLHRRVAPSSGRRSGSRRLRSPSRARPTPASTAASPLGLGAGGAGRVRPEQLVQRRRVAQRDGRARVRDRRLDLAAVPHDARVGQQALDVALRRSARDRSGSKPANAARKASRLRRIVSHERPDWKPSRQSRS